IRDANTKSKPHVYDNVNVTVRNFSFSSQFPFTVTVDLPGGSNLKLDGKAGPINPNDAAQTPLEAKLEVKRLDLAASGFVDPSSGIAGLADFDGTVASDGHVVRSNGTMKADKLKTSAKGGTLSTALAISGPVAKPVITGPIKLVQTKLAGFNLGSKLSAINALSGAQTGSDTSIQNFSTDAHVAPDGVRTENVDLII